MTRRELRLCDDQMFFVWQQMQQDMSAHGLMGLSEMDLARFDGGGMNMNMNMNMGGDVGARGRYGRDGGMSMGMGMGKERGRGDSMGLGEPKRSPLLEEFRTSKVNCTTSRNNTTTTLRFHIVYLCCVLCLRSVHPNMHKPLLYCIGAGPLYAWLTTNIALPESRSYA